jgi:hypothetical protein
VELCDGENDVIQGRNIFNGVGLNILGETCRLHQDDAIVVIEYKSLVRSCLHLDIASVTVQCSSDKG